MLIFFVLIIISISAVSAEDNSTIDLSAIEHSVPVDTVEIAIIDNNYVNAIDTTSTNARINSTNYTSIGEALNASGSNDAIYLGEGTFSGENNRDITLDKNNTGGTISLIGAGVNKTVIDLGGHQFLKINKGTSIIIKNLTIKNGNSTYGGVIYSQGTLTVDTVRFINNVATSSGGSLYISSDNKNTIINCQFINNSARTGGAICSYSAVEIQNCTFNDNNAASNGGSIYLSNKDSIINASTFNSSKASTSGGAIYASAGNISNCMFENCNATTSGGAIYGGSIYLQNNTFLSCNANKGSKIFSTGILNAHVTFSNVTIPSSKFTLNAIVTDDRNNTIAGRSISFYLNNTSIGSATTDNDGKASLTISKILDNGVYNITTNVNTFTIVKGIANVTVNTTTIDLYVSPDGNDSNNGSKSSPFKTIYKALTEGFSKNINVVIHLLNGTFKGENNTNITFDSMGNLKIVGTTGTIIDGENQNWVFRFKNLNVDLENIQFEKLYDKSYDGLIKIEGDYKNPIIVNVNNCTFRNSIARDYIYTGNYASGLMSNITATNNSLDTFIYGKVKVENVTIANNTGSGSNLFFIITEIKNSKIINNNFKAGSILIYFDTNGVGNSINNLYENNTCSILQGGSNNVFSINDTFINNGNSTAVGGAIVVNDRGKITIINSTFKNNKASKGGAIYHGNGILELINCTFKDNHATQGNDIYGDTSNNRNPQLWFSNNLIFNNKNSSNVKTNLTATITLDNLSISGYSVDFYIDGVYKGSAQFVNNTATFIVAGLKDGKYTINGSMPNIQNSTVTPGILMLDANPSDVYDVYVSQYGSDNSTNDGTKAKPFATIKHAFEVAIEKNVLSIVIHIIGTIKGEGNVNLTLIPYVDLTIIGEDRDSSIIDAENNKYIMDITPYTDDVKVYLKNLTIKNGITGRYSSYISDMGLIRFTGMYGEVDNCIFTNNTGYAISVDKLYSTFIINNSKFINGNGAIYSYESTLDLRILNCEFIGNNLTKNAKQLIYIYDIYSPSSSSPHYNVTNVLIENSTFKNNILSSTSCSLVYLYGGTNTLIKNCSFENTINGSAICGYPGQNTDAPGLANITISNCYFTKNARDIVYDYMSGSISTGIRPIFNIINTKFEESGAFIHTDQRYTEPIWNIYNSSFINMKNSVNFGVGSKGKNQNYNETLVKIVGCLFVNSPGSGGGNITNSAFYNSKFTISGYANNNFWNASQPDCTLTNIGHLDSWLVPVLITNNASGPVQEIRLVYMSYNNMTGEYTYYDVSDVPLLPLNVVVRVTDGNILPNHGILTAEGLIFNYTYNGVGNQTIFADLDNGITSILNVTFYKTKTSVKVTANTADLYVGDYIEGSATVSDDKGNPVNGTVNVYVNGVLKGTFKVINGKIDFKVQSTESGPSELYVEYVGDDYYQPSNDNLMFNTKASTTITGKDITMYYKNGTRYEIVLLDANGKPLANKNVVFEINGQNYTRMTDANGIASIAINLNPGEYVIKTYYNGTDRFVSNSNNITVLSVFSENKDIVLYFRNGTKFTIKLVDGNGKPLANAEVTFNVNGVFYKRTTDANGIASLNINLNAVDGGYIITAESPNGDKVSNHITVLPILEGKNIVKYFRNGTQYQVKVVDGKGNPLANTEVVFNINGVFYKRTSNDEGIVTLSINLNPGTYSVTASYNGFSINNKVEVKPIISAHDLTKTFSETKYFEAKVLDAHGNPAVNKTVKFNVNGVFYYRNTDSNGIAKLSIHLASGKYIITSEFEGLQTSNTITVI